MAAEQLTYEQMLDLVSKWYKTDASNIVDTLNKYGVQYGDMESLYGLIENTPYGFIYNSDGSLRSASYRYVTTYKQASQVAAQQINSNVQVAEKTQFDIPLESEVAQETGKVSFSSGLKAVGTGAKSTLNFTFKEVAPAVAAASAGITIGKTIDKALYNINPDFWNEKGMSSLNPETWNSITSGDKSTGARLFNMIFGLNPDDGTSQAYMDENALAYLALYMQNKDVFSIGNEVIEDITVDNKIISGINRIVGTTKEYNINNIQYYLDGVIAHKIPKGYTTRPGSTRNNPNRKLYSTIISNTDTNTYTLIIASKESGQMSYASVNDSLTIGEGEGVSSTVKYTYDEKSVVYCSFSLSKTLYVPIINAVDYSNSDINKIAWALIYGTYKVKSAVEGIGTQPDAKTPDLSDVTDTAGALQKLKETYPELWNNAVSQDVAQPDGTTKHYVYVPVGFPSTTGATDTQPTTGSQTQNNTKIDPKTDPQTLPEDLVKTLTRILTPTNTPNPPDTGGGDTPVVVPVTGSASSLYAIYNPTLSEINSFGAWLWSDNFVEQIKKLFNDPMQAIIGLHRVYATPVTGGSQNIKVGYLDSGVSSKIVTNQYATIDCGTVTLDEYFFNVFDYSPYTEVSLYLPFIGIVNLDVADVMRASIHIVYHVDVLTGACLAEVKVNRDNAGGTLYQYAGNAAVTLPISSGSYMGIVASLASIAGGVAGTIASGGAAAPMLIGAAGSALNARTRVEHSGGFSGNAGAMGGKIPYLIISRPQTELAENYGVYIGNPSNHTVTLGSCSGYVQVKECHLENIPATQNELNQIESLLKGGVLL